STSALHLFSISPLNHQPPSATAAVPVRVHQTHLNKKPNPALPLRRRACDLSHLAAPGPLQHPHHRTNQPPLTNRELPPQFVKLDSPRFHFPQPYHRGSAN